VGKRERGRGERGKAAFRCVMPANAIARFAELRVEEVSLVGWIGTNL